MNRERFEFLLDAYGADFRRWPAADRTAGEAFAAKHAEEASEAIRAAGALDRALDAARDDAIDTALLARRILRQRPRPWIDRRAAIALAACAVFGIALGYGAGTLAPAPDFDDAYFAAAFEAPFAIGDEG